MEPMRMRLWMASRVTPSLSAASVTLSRSTESSSDTPHTPSEASSHGCRVPQSGAWRLASPEAREHAVMLLQAQAWRSLLPQASLTPLDLLISVSLLGPLPRHLL